MKNRGLKEWESWGREFAKRGNEKRKKKMREGRNFEASVHAVFFKTVIELAPHNYSTSLRVGKGQNAFHHSGGTRLHTMVTSKMTFCSISPFKQVVK